MGIWVRSYFMADHIQTWMVPTLSSTRPVKTLTRSYGVSWTRGMVWFFGIHAEYPEHIPGHGGWNFDHQPAVNFSPSSHLPGARFKLRFVGAQFIYKLEQWPD